jgi:formate/nitrite transporter FocA (FNT family)
MYFIPMGILLRNNEGVISQIAKMGPDTSTDRLNVMGLLGNLLPVTLGNIIGGAVMVGLVYWLIIILPQKQKNKKV